VHQYLYVDVERVINGVMMIYHYVMVLTIVKLVLLCNSYDAEIVFFCLLITLNYHRCVVLSYFVVDCSVALSVLIDLD